MQNQRNRTSNPPKIIREQTGMAMIVTRAEISDKKLSSAVENSIENYPAMGSECKNSKKKTFLPKSANHNK